MLALQPDQSLAPVISPVGLPAPVEAEEEGGEVAPVVHKPEVKSVNFLSFYQNEELSDRILSLVEADFGLISSNERSSIENECPDTSVSRLDTSTSASRPDSDNDCPPNMAITFTTDPCTPTVEQCCEADGVSALVSARKLKRARTSVDPAECLIAVKNNKRAKRASMSVPITTVIDDSDENVKSEYRLAADRQASGSSSFSEPYLLPIHSIIFCANSEYFRSLLTSNAMLEANERVVKICLNRGELQPFLKLVKMFYQHDRELMICDDENTNEGEKISEIISLLKLADKFLCPELITFLHSLCTDFEPTQISTLNIIVEFVTKIQGCVSATLHESCEFWTAPCLRFLTSGKTRIFPLESVLAQDFRKFIDEASMETIDFVVRQAGVNVLKQNSLVTFAVLALEQKEASGEEIKIILEALCAESFCKDAQFIVNTLTSHHPFLSTWCDYGKWYTNLLEQVLISLVPRPVNLNPSHAAFMKNCLNWPIVKFVAGDESYSSLDASEWTMKSETSGPHVLGNGYLFSLVSVVLKKAAGYARHFQVSFQVDIENLEATPHAELKFLFQCCPRALGGGPSKNEHPWDSDVTVPPYEKTFGTTPFTMTSTRPITFSHFKDMFFHICII